LTIKKPGTPLFEPFLISFILDIKDVSVENPDEMRIAYVLNQTDMRRAVELIRLGLEAYLK
jgi:hypothetical protein